MTRGWTLLRDSIAEILDFEAYLSCSLIGDVIEVNLSFVMYDYQVYMYNLLTLEIQI